MDLNLNALIGLANLVPIAVTLRKVFAPDFDMPDAFINVLAKLDSSRMKPQFVGCFAGSPLAQHAPHS